VWECGYDDFIVFYVVAGSCADASGALFVEFNDVFFWGDDFSLSWEVWTFDMFAQFFYAAGGFFEEFEAGVDDFG